MVMKETKFFERISRIFNTTEEISKEILSRPRKSSFRINTLKTQNIEEIAKLTKIIPIKWCQNAFNIEGDKSLLVASDVFKNSEIYIQNASSLIPPLVLEPKENDVVLDMCAAPGGKTIHIANITNNNAFLYINENDNRRLKNLTEVLSTHNVKIVHCFNQPAQFLHKYTNQKFDKILLDAPCSGEGMIDFTKKNPLVYWSTDKIKKLSFVQKTMLKTAYEMLNPGGVLVYSTCTFAPEENEEVIDYGIKTLEDLTVEPINIDISNIKTPIIQWNNKNFDNNVLKAIRVTPTEFMEGFFVCKIKKGI